MKTVLVTGANGALGRAVVERLSSDKQYQVMTTYRQTPDTGDFALNLHDVTQLADVVARNTPDLLLHCAASFGNDFDEAYAINVESTRQLLNAVHTLGLNTRIVLVGSAAEYGVIAPEENPIAEDHVLRPVSVYGLTKAWQTQLANFYASLGVNVVVARVFNLDGQGLSERLFIGRLQKQIAEVLAGNKSIIELGSLSATRDYLSVDVAAEQLLAITEHGIAGQVYHVASGVPVTMREVLNRYLTAYQLDPAIVQEAVSLSNRTGYDVPVIYADITKTLHLLNN